MWLWIMFALGLLLVAEAYGADWDHARMMDLQVLAAKIIGGTIGSAIAVVFQSDKKFPKFIIGLNIGVIFAPFPLMLWDLEHTLEMWVSSSCLCGLLGYMILWHLYSRKTRQALQKRVEEALESE